MKSVIDYAVELGSDLGYEANHRNEDRQVTLQYSERGSYIRARVSKMYGDDGVVVRMEGPLVTKRRETRYSITEFNKLKARLKRNIKTVKAEADRVAARARVAAQLQDDVTKAFKSYTDEPFEIEHNYGSSYVIKILGVSIVWHTFDGGHFSGALRLKNGTHVDIGRGEFHETLDLIRALQPMLEEKE